ncbi:hypothetical protein [Alistipes sp. ZOR0009]|jgi:hypothetical protein|uniref:hypothetical protein n=1 Tax=Alistipes sp. ZOR0009 TaxID=1339253 RepID=UPI00068B8D78|nr:hypothetical protein [Alistipes sp. ZOR0009]
MKANKDFRPGSKDTTYESDDLKKGKKLTPDKKPKNEKKELYDVDDFEEEYDLQKYKRESISDFYDEGEEEDEDYEEEYDEDEEYDDEDYDDDDDEYEEDEYEEDEVEIKRN